MQDADLDRFAAALNGVAVVHRYEIPRLELQAYWRLLSHDWEIAEFEAVCETICRDPAVKFMPKAPEFYAWRRKAGLTAIEAFEQAFEHAKCGAYRRGLRLSHEIERAVKAIGGYSAIGGYDLERLSFLRRDFCAAFNDINDCDAPRAALPGPVNPNIKAIIGSTAKRLTAQ